MIEPIAAWGRRLLLLLTAALLIALPAAWISSQYFGNEINATLSFHANDGWCNWGYTPDFGVHCFGDYVQPLIGAQADFDLLDPEQAIPSGAIPGATNEAYISLYPPVSQLPHVLAALWSGSFVGRDVTFFAYMALLALAVLAPAVWVAWGWRKSAFGLVPLLLLGVATIPAISALDRGNSAGFVVPCLLAFGVFLGRDPRWVAPAAAVAAALIRPQFILIVLGLVAIRAWRQALVAVGVFGAITLASFTLMPAGFAQSARAWWDTVSGLSSVGFSGITSDSPANTSIARSTTALAGWISNGPGVIGDFGGWLRSTVVDQPIIPLAVLSAIALIVFLIGTGRITRAIAITVPFALAAGASGISPIYYLSFAIVLGALVVGNRLPFAPALLDSGDRRWGYQAWRWLLVVAITLSLSPIVLAGDTPSGSPLMRNSFILENIGRLWLGVVVAALAWAAWSLIPRTRNRLADGRQHHHGGVS